MSTKTSEFDWNRTRAFLATAETGSFSAAARLLGSTQPTVGRQVARLEEELGVMLFERVGTRLEMTSTALDLVEHAKAMGEGARRLALAAAGQSNSIEGTVKLTTSEVIAGHLIPPVLSQLRRTHPRIEVEVVASNEVRDLHRREADIAVRNAQPKHPDLIGKQLGVREGYLYASDEYLERIGGLESPEDILRAEIFAFDRTDLMVEGLNAFGLPVTREQFPIATSNHLVQWELCKRGLGICAIMSEVGDAAPGVRRVLPQIMLPIQMWLVAHRELRTSRRIRVVFDALVEHLKID